MPLYNPVERAYTRLIARMVEHSGRTMALVAAVLIVPVGLALTRVPTGFIPLEDQGYLLVAVQLPDAASLERTQAVLAQISAMRRSRPPGSSTRSPSAASPRSMATPRSPTPVSSTSRSRTGTSATSTKGQDLKSLYQRLVASSRARGSPRACRSCRRRRSRASACRAASRCRSSSPTAASTTASCRRISDLLVSEAQYAKRARARDDHLSRRRAADRAPRSTAPRRSRSASPSAASSTRCRATWARPTPTR